MRNGRDQKSLGTVSREAKNSETTHKSHSADKSFMSGLVAKKKLLIWTGCTPARHFGNILCSQTVPIVFMRILHATTAALAKFSRSLDGNCLISSKAIEKAVAPCALQRRDVASARGMRGVPRLCRRGLIQTRAVMVAQHG